MKFDYFIIQGQKIMRNILIFKGRSYVDLSTTILNNLSFVIYQQIYQMYKILIVSHSCAIALNDQKWDEKGNSGFTHVRQMISDTEENYD